MNPHFPPNNHLNSANPYLNNALPNRPPPPFNGNPYANQPATNQMNQPRIYAPAAYPSVYNPMQSMQYYQQYYQQYQQPTMLNYLPTGYPATMQQPGMQPYYQPLATAYPTLPNQSNPSFHLTNPQQTTTESNPTMVQPVQPPDNFPIIKPAESLKDLKPFSNDKKVETNPSSIPPPPPPVSPPQDNSQFNLDEFVISNKNSSYLDMLQPKKTNNSFLNQESPIGSNSPNFKYIDNYQLDEDVSKKTNSDAFSNATNQTQDKREFDGNGLRGTYEEINDYSKINLINNQSHSILPAHISASTSTNNLLDNNIYGTNFNNQPIKKQKIDVDSLDQNKIKNQLEQINQLKNFNPINQTNQFSSFNQSSLINRSQELLSPEDECWLRLLNPSQRKIIDDIIEDEKNFDDMYKSWHDDYNEFINSNKNKLDLQSFQSNLDKESDPVYIAFKKNELEWEEWKTNLLNRKVKFTKRNKERIDEVRRQIIGDKGIDHLNQMPPNINHPNLTSNLAVNNLENENTQFTALKNQVETKDFSSAANTIQQNDQDDCFILEEPVEENSNNFQTPLDSVSVNQKTPLSTVSSSQKTPLESQVLDSNLNVKNQPVTLFPASETMTQMNKTNEEPLNTNKTPKKKTNIEDVSKLFTYLNETRDALELIDKLDFKMQENKILYNQQLESIKKTIESHSGSENELSKDDDIIDSDPPAFMNQNDQNLNEASFHLSSVLNKIQEISRNPIIENRSRFEPSNPSTSNQFNMNPILNRTFGSNQNLNLNKNISSLNPAANLERNINQNFNRNLTRLEPESSFSRRPIVDQSSIENDFLSRFGLEITVNKVLSYKNIEYFLSPPSFTLAAEDLLELPGREYRPNLICLILRGHPSSGKSKFATLVCKAELEHNARLPKLLSFSEYLEVENSLTKINELVNDQHAYRNQLLQNAFNSKKMLFADFKTVINEQKSSFLILNSVNSKITDFEDFYVFAKLHGYSTYIAEMDFLDYSDIPTSTTYNEISYDEWVDLSRNWELTPSKYLKLKVNNFIRNRMLQQPMLNQSAVLNSPTQSKDDDDDDFSFENQAFLRRVDVKDELELAKLDDFRMKLRIPVEMFWSLPNDYYKRSSELSRIKRVRFLDVEQKNY